MLFPEPCIKELIIGKCEFVSPADFNAKGLEKITFLKTAEDMFPDIYFCEDENKAPNLKEIIIEDGNPVLGNDVVRDFAKDGIWYQTDCEANETTLIFYPPAKENETFKVPSFIKILDSHCFHYNPHIKKIIMPKNFNGIVEEFAFSNCKNLETIVFQSYIEVKEDFFINCPNLKQVIAETPTPYKIEK